MSVSGQDDEEGSSDDEDSSDDDEEAAYVWEVVSSEQIRKSCFCDYCWVFILVVLLITLLLLSLYTVEESHIFKDFVSTPAALYPGDQLHCQLQSKDLETGTTDCSIDQPPFVQEIPKLIQHSQRGVTKQCASSTGWIPPNCTVCNKEFVHDTTHQTCNQCKPNNWGTFCNNTCPSITPDNKPCNGNGVCLDGVKGVGKCICDGFFLTPESNCANFHIQYNRGVFYWILASLAMPFVLFNALFFSCSTSKMQKKCQKCSDKRCKKCKKVLNVISNCMSCCWTCLYCGMSRKLRYEYCRPSCYKYLAVLLNNVNIETKSWLILAVYCVVSMFILIEGIDSGKDMRKSYNLPLGITTQDYLKHYIQLSCTGLFLFSVTRLVISTIRNSMIGKKMREQRDRVASSYVDLTIDFEETRQEFQQDARKLQQGWVVGYKDIKLQKVIGQGAFGEVWKGRWRGLDVAVKKMYPEPEYYGAIMSKEIASTSKESFGSNGSKKSMNDISQKMLDDLEVGVMMRLRHPRIVAFLGAGEVIDPPHEGETEPKIGIFVMLQYCAGGDLSHRLTPVTTDSILKFPWKERIQCAIDVAEGMVFIHNEGIIHRDLKSVNILCDENGRCMIADLGLAKKIGSEDEQEGLRARAARSDSNGVQPVATAWKGTVPWMAPEVIRSGYNNSVDVYSFAVIMWELITGRVRHIIFFI